ncbi:pyocin knob domain-containing protein [Oceaniovalibus sp. ACAM 378]|uniref:pyocin knob domain-containing protein n=1 Tax=Oceaniovalibus sp. ACAM 378 TaxID=2599923 RepID=UPI0011D7B755|nr:pyocin knob domain-containing protein [Oceaniovalibus sp. ACAM 378]TYB83976.1 hypothetical protein FQ320_23440 [Oceaniovalibus sp. ACAM 378]
MAWYSTGTVSVTNGSKAVTGSGTGWYGALQNGWGFVGPDGRSYEIDTVNSATSITLKQNYQGSTAAAQQYSAYPTMSLTIDLATRINALISDFQAVVDGPGAGKFGYGTEAAPGIAFAADSDTGMRRVSANELALVAGGLDQLILRANIATGGAVQSSKVDATMGKLLRTGAFGWGELSNPETAMDLDDTTLASGAWRTIGTSTGTFPGGGAFFGTLLNIRYDNGNMHQLVRNISNNDVYVRRYRSAAGYGFSPWTMLYAQDNILRTVSQVAGIPTGGLIEKGGNANGQYVRFADGTQICWGQVVATGIVCGVAYAGGFRSGSGTSVNFAAAFIANPKIVAQVDDLTTSDALVIGDTASVSNFQLRYWRPVAATVACSAGYVAIGKWF